MRHGLYVWSAKNFTGKGPGLLDRVAGWFRPSKAGGKLAVNDLVDVILRTRPALVTVKTRDGRASMNAGFAETVLEAADAVGAERSTWAYVYPWNPSGKRPSEEVLHRYLDEQAANIAADAFRLRARRVVLNAEKQWFHVEDAVVVYFVERVRWWLDAKYHAGGQRTPVVAWSSYAMPSSFPAYPWGAWCRMTDEAWPQLYSAKGSSSDGYAERGVRSARQHNELGARRIVFGGPLYRGPKQMRAFASGLSRIAGTIVPPYGKAPLTIDDLGVWWAAEQVTQDTEAVLLEAR